MSDFEKYENMLASGSTEGPPISNGADAVEAEQLQAGTAGGHSHHTLILHGYTPREHQLPQQSAGPQRRNALFCHRQRSREVKYLLEEMTACLTGPAS